MAIKYPITSAIVGILTPLAVTVLFAFAIWYMSNHIALCVDRTSSYKEITYELKFIRICS